MHVLPVMGEFWEKSSGFTTSSTDSAFGKCPAYTGHPFSFCLPARSLGPLWLSSNPLFCRNPHSHGPAYPIYSFITAPIDTLLYQSLGELPMRCSSFSARHLSACNRAGGQHTLVERHMNKCCKEQSSTEKSESMRKRILMLNQGSAVWTWSWT